MLAGTRDRANCWQSDSQDRKATTAIVANKKAHPSPGGLSDFSLCQTAELEPYSTEKLCSDTGSAV